MKDNQIDAWLAQLPLTPTATLKRTRASKTASRPPLGTQPQEQRHSMRLRSNRARAEQGEMPGPPKGRRRPVARSQQESENKQPPSLFAERLAKEHALAVEEAEKEEVETFETGDEESESMMELLDTPPPARKRRRGTPKRGDDTRSASKTTRSPPQDIHLTHRLNHVHIDPDEWHKKSQRTPQNVFDLLKLLDLYRQGQGIIAADQKTDHFGLHVSHQIFKIMVETADGGDDGGDGGDGGDAAPTATRATYGRSPSWSFMEAVIHETKRFWIAASEASWNCFVHAPVLKEALRLAARGKYVQVNNVATASIGPKTLCPRREGNLNPFTTRVDFAYTLHTEQLLDAFERVNLVEGIKSFNQTSYRLIETTPICISIETKGAKGKIDVAQTQLGVWAIAQHNKLVQLVAQKANRQTAAQIQLPALPLVIAEGATWSLVIASRRDSTSTDFFYCGSIGGTESSVELLKLFAVLQVLIYWSSTTYLDWFVKNAAPEE